jgi:hypothetical protein
LEEKIRIWLENIHKIYPDQANESNFKHVTMKLADVFFMDPSIAKSLHEEYHLSSA